MKSTRRGWNLISLGKGRDGEENEKREGKGISQE